MSTDNEQKSYTPKQVREIIGLISKSQYDWTPEKADRLTALVGGKVGDFTYSGQFSHLVFFAVDPATNTIVDVHEFDGIALHGNEFVEWARERDHLQSECWGKMWDWGHAPGQFCCISTSGRFRRPTGIGTLAEEAFQIVEERAAAPRPEGPSPRT